ncbi:unnamed protein product [Dicrocoelium dendriticum]|nr:unnamed protein product [Dicrocoelium dendriticum]
MYPFRFATKLLEPSKLSLIHGSPVHQKNHLICQNFTHNSSWNTEANIYGSTSSGTVEFCASLSLGCWSNFKRLYKSLGHFYVSSECPRGTEASVRFTLHLLRIDANFQQEWRSSTRFSLLPYHASALACQIFLCTYNRCSSKIHLSAGYSIMIDTHCHLCDSAFDTDLDTVVDRAVATGVYGALVLTEDRQDMSTALDLKARFPDWVNLGFGIHPLQQMSDGRSRSRTITPEELYEAQDFITKHSDQLIAVGERRLLVSQIRLARQLDLPLNVHSRSASKPTIELLKLEGATRVQMHAFDGRPSHALAGVAAGFYFSVPPCVYRSKQKQELVKVLPLTSLLLESDAPALAAVAGDRNEPAEILKSCQFIADAKGTDVDTVRRVTTENALKLYPKMIMKCIS